MTHATNEQMALVMGWTQRKRYLSEWYTNEDETESRRVNDWYPTHDLNHTALVEARLAELELIEAYMIELAQRAMTFLPKPITENTPFFIGPAYLLATASAQTRCDAAWAAYQAWKEQAK